MLSVARKRLREDSSSASTGSSSSGGAKKREKNGGKMDKGTGQKYNTAVWHFEVVDREHVSLLKCSICSQFSEKLECMRNFRPAFFYGSTNILISTVKDHATTDMHTCAMHLLKKQLSSSVIE